MWHVCLNAPSQSSGQGNKLILLLKWWITAERHDKVEEIGICQPDWIARLEVESEIITVVIFKWASCCEIAIMWFINNNSQITKLLVRSGNIVMFQPSALILILVRDAVVCMVWHWQGSQLLIVFKINWIIIKSKCPKLRKMPDTNSQSLKWYLDSRVFWPTNNPKPRNFSISVVNDGEKQQNFTFKKLEWENVWHIFVKNDWNDYLIVEKNVATNSFSIGQSIYWLIVAALGKTAGQAVDQTISRQRAGIANFWNIQMVYLKCSWNYIVFSLIHWEGWIIFFRGMNLLFFFWSFIKQKSQT